MTAAWEDLAARVAGALAAAYPGWRGDLVPVGRGLEAGVFRTDLHPHGAVAIKAPWRRFPGGSYGPEVDCRALLRQEHALAAWADRLGVPVPAPVALHESEAQDCLISGYVDDDGSPPDPAGFGRLLRMLHDAPPPDPVPVAHGGFATLGGMIADRIARRFESLEKLTGERLPREHVDIASLGAALPDGRRSLLHMDLRPVNLRCRDGRIVAVFDWSNAVIGDPAFELARMQESGTLTDAVLEAYGTRDWSARLPEIARIAYHLDAALLLAIVFRICEPDPDRAARATARVRELLAAFPEGGPPASLSG